MEGIINTWICPSSSCDVVHWGRRWRLQWDWWCQRQSPTILARLIQKQWNQSRLSMLFRMNSSTFFFLVFFVKLCNKELVIFFFKESRFRRRMPVNRCCVQRPPKLSSTTFRSSYQIHIQRETFKPDLLRVLFPKSRAIDPHLYATSLKGIAPWRRRFATSENQSPDGRCSSQTLRKAVNKATGKGQEEEEDDRYQSLGRSVDILLRKRGEILLLLRSSHTSGRCFRCRSHGRGSCNGHARLLCRREHILVRFTTFRNSGSSGVFFFFFTTIQHKAQLFLPQQFFNTKRFLAAKVESSQNPMITSSSSSFHNPQTPFCNFFCSSRNGWFSYKQMPLNTACFHWTNATEVCHFCCFRLLQFSAAWWWTCVVLSEFYNLF